MGEESLGESWVAVARDFGVHVDVALAGVAHKEELVEELGALHIARPQAADDAERPSWDGDGLAVLPGPEEVGG